MPTLIFVHGACVRDAAWWWSKMTKPLADHGIATAVVPLPSCGEMGETLGDLYDDVEACRQVIADIDEPVVLCGHSYGGMIITEAGGDDRVNQLLYLTSVMPDAGQSQADLIGSEPAPWLRSEEHTSELQSRENLVCRLLLEKKKKKKNIPYFHKKKKKKKKY